MGDGKQLQIANIQFNNLDVIGEHAIMLTHQNCDILTNLSNPTKKANQETIVELLSFANRVFPKKPTRKFYSESMLPSESDQQPCNDIPTVTPLPRTAKPTTKDQPLAITTVRTEITFDFHRLNVLVLRAVVRDTHHVARKVGTFTMSEAKIHATLDEAITVEGSLGGLQVIDLTPEGIAHQRILSVGKDPLTEAPNLHTHDLLSSLTQEIYGHSSKNELILDAQQALSFHVSRDLNASVSINIRMASVWYTHCARLMQELSWCATEFKQYLK